MRCHYEILDLPRTATDDEIKKAYRRLALQWHPDKNPDRLQECNEFFPVIQQAYEVLTDPQERAWYDRHREDILKGGVDEHYKDNSLNLFGYFSSSCYSGYGDDEKGFYSVYQHAFDTISQEDIDFSGNETCKIPRFGSADSPYDTIVGPFYAYWQSYSTSKPYSWLDKFDIQQAPNRRILRLMEKDNTKIREKAKRERNDEVRALVEFVRKRDKRLSAYRKLLEEQRKKQQAMVEEQRLTQKLKHLKTAGEYKDANWHDNCAREEDLKEIESHFGDIDCFSNANKLDQNADMASTSMVQEENYNSDSVDGDQDDLYCVACEKMFKTVKSYENHERSKRHKENVEVLKSVMDAEEIQLLGIDKQCQKVSSPSEKPIKNGPSSIPVEKDALETFRNDDQLKSETTSDDLFGKTHDQPTNKNKPNDAASIHEASKETRCSTCKENFPTRNKLFTHLKETDHATLKFIGQKGGKRNNKRT